MISADEIRAIEHIGFRALPALETLEYDGWLLRFANGFTGRANSVNPLLGSSLPVDEKIAYCEEQYRVRDIPLRFRLTEIMQPAGLEMALAAHGYNEIFNETDVQVCDLQAHSSQLYPAFHYHTTPDPDWVEGYRTMNNVAQKDATTLHTIISNIQTPICCGWIGDQAVGLAVVDGEWVGLFDIVVAPAARGKGLGRELVSSLMAWGYDQGAKFAYLQVTAVNIPARALYARLGYQTRYRYWYRRKG